MPAHLRKRGRYWYLVDGNIYRSLKTSEEDQAKQMLHSYVCGKLGVLPSNMAEPWKQFGKPDTFLALRALRFPCVYAVVRDNQVIYIGSSVNGHSRILHTGHKMNDYLLETDCIAFWTCDSIGEARDLEKEMIVAIQPNYNRVGK